MLKRSLHYLPTLILIFLFSNSSLAQCPQDTVDLGYCDTLHVIPWPETDTCFVGCWAGGCDTICINNPGEDFPRFLFVPLLVTHDSNTFWWESKSTYVQDSIAAFMVPLEFTRTNQSAYCSLSAYWNSNATIIYDPNFLRSIWRHFHWEDLDSNRMASLAGQFQGLEWSLLNIETTSDSSWYHYGPDSVFTPPHVWMSLIPTNPTNRRWWEGDRTLLLTLTFTVEDTMHICLDSTWWPPSSKLSFTRHDARVYIPRHNLPLCIFDTQGPQFDLRFCIEENTCSLSVGGIDMVDQEDSVRICATNIDPDIKGNITIIDSEKIFLKSSIVLKPTDEEDENCGCDKEYNTAFKIPDMRSTGTYRGIDADTGHWYICGWAQDSAGNVDTICIGHDDLQYMIDTQDPAIDSVTWEHTYDWNSDGKIGLGDCIMIIGWGLTNPCEPELELDKMEVDMSWYSGIPNDWVELDDVLEHNRVFRKEFCLTEPVNIDSTGCPVNFLVRAWDNACNYDTLRGEICGSMDLDPPDVSVLYEWDTDYDTSFACIGIGDKVFIEATVPGDDIVSVVAWMDSAGIDELMQHEIPLPDRGSGIYDTVWTVTEPPIQYGKDKDNSTPPPTDNDYRVRVVACDDGGNCDTAASDTLNKTLDTRIPRPIGFNCPDSVPCALQARSMPGGRIRLVWDRNCDENDAWYFHVWADDGPGYDSIGATYDGECGACWPDSNIWISEPLPEGYYTFKIRTEDNCSNAGDFSCVVGAWPRICGDANSDYVVDVGDVIYLIGYLYIGASPPDPLCIGDVDCNAEVDNGDLIYLINYLFLGTSPPCTECCPQ